MDDSDRHTRAGQATGTVDVGFTEDLQTLGDDLLVLQKTAADYQFEVRRIAAADGAVSAPLLTDARGGTALDDGTFLVGRPTSLDLLSLRVVSRRLPTVARPATSRLTSPPWSRARSTMR